MPAGVLVPFLAPPPEVLFGAHGTDTSPRGPVKGQGPRSVPGVLPGIGHQDHVGVVQLLPGPVSPVPSRCGRRWLARVAHEPAVNIVMIELLGPEQARKGLPLDEALVGA